MRKEFKLVEGTSEGPQVYNFVRQLNKAIAEGWQPYGQMNTTAVYQDAHFDANVFFSILVFRDVADAEVSA